MRRGWLLACAAAAGLAGGAAAQDLGAAASALSTEQLARFETELTEARRRLEGERAAARAGVASTQPDMLPEELAAAEARPATLEQIDLVLQQRGQILRQAGSLLAARAGLDREAAELARRGPPGKPPWPLATLDRLGDEIAGEELRLPALEAEVAATAHLLAQASGQADALGRTRRDLAERPVGGGDGSTKRALAARIGAIDLELQLAREVVALRELEGRADALAVENAHGRIRLLRLHAAGIQGQLVFKDQDLAAELGRLEAAAKEVGQSEERVRNELGAAEERWGRIKQRIDLSRAPDPVLAEELATREREVQVRHRELAMLASRAARLQAMQAAWRRRHALLLHRFRRDELRTWERELAAGLEQMGREETLQSARLGDLRRDLAALQARALEAGPGDAKRVRWIREAAKLVERQVRMAEEALAELADARKLLGRLGRELAPHVEAGLLARWAREVKEAALEYWEAHLERLVWPTLRILGLLLLGIPLVWLLSSRAHGAFARLYGGQGGMIAGKIVFWVGLTAVLIAVLNELGVGLAPLLGAAGITGVALGFAAQTSVSNMISGLFLIAESPFAVDDVITVEGVTGTVLSVDLLSIKLRTFDNRFVRIPNETILKTNVTNLSRYPIRRVDLALRLSYREDMAKVRELLLEIARSNPRGLIQPAPQVFFQGFGDAGVEVQFSVWCARADFVDLKASLMLAIQTAFAREGIALGLPQLELAVREGGPPAATSRFPPASG